MRVGTLDGPPTPLLGLTQKGEQVLIVDLTLEDRSALEMGQDRGEHSRGQLGIAESLHEVFMVLGKTDDELFNNLVERSHQINKEHKRRMLIHRLSLQETTNLMAGEVGRLTRQPPALRRQEGGTQEGHQPASEEPVVMLGHNVTDQYNFSAGHVWCLRVGFPKRSVQLSFVGKWLNRGRLSLDQDWAVDSGHLFGCYVGQVLRDAVGSSSWSFLGFVE